MNSILSCIPLALVLILDIDFRYECDEVVLFQLRLTSLLLMYLSGINV